ncbi:MerR family DNA-binding transcriptional regulator [Corynebacterium sp. CCM 9204]|uniref:MerR family DNA-binding transcriptional regulator n=1 Tax=Corynebacterium sp. CCM 9204 TaxID=3057616 RepID=UPI003525528C
MTMLTIRELAAFAGVSARTIRHYHDIGLMPPAGLDSAGRRIYVPADAVRLARVRSLAGLDSPELVGLSDGNAALFRRWREIGVAEEFIRAIGRVWVVCRSVFPDTFDDGVRWATEALESAEYRVLLRYVSHLWTVEPDDPLVAEIARRAADYIRQLDEEELRRGEFPTSVVLDSVIGDIPPAIIRFNELVGQLTGTEVAR